MLHKYTPLPALSAEQVARFWSHVAEPDGDACREWLLSRIPAGYGRVIFGRGREFYAHRVAFELTNGPIPIGLEVHHRCVNPSCCNPAHLEAVTPQQNVAYSDRHISKRRRAQTHCKRGHEFSADNTRIDPSGTRHCRTCDRERRRSRGAA